MRKNFLNYLHDFMTQDSLIESIFSTKSASCTSEIASSSVLLLDTRISKASDKSILHDFYPKHLNHKLGQNQTLKGI
jgi:hypothetical protein